MLVLILAETSAVTPLPASSGGLGEFCGRPRVLRALVQRM